MKPHRPLMSAWWLILLVLAWPAHLAAADPQRPNVVLIMTDNHSPWTLGCYGNQEIRTPNIDRLSREGFQFNRAFANNAVCSPTRATVLTGLTCSQHGVHRYLGAGGAQIGPQAYCTIGEFRTLTGGLGLVAGGLLAFGQGPQLTRLFAQRIARRLKRALISLTLIDIGHRETGGLAAVENDDPRRGAPPKHAPQTIDKL